MSRKSEQPLAGKRVAVTRAHGQNSSLVGKVSQLGADVIELPLIETTRRVAKQDLADVFLELGSYDWLVFTSPNGVRHFFDVFFEIYDDIRTLGLLRIACVGEATAGEVEALHLKVECRPETATGAALAEALIATGSLDNAKMIVITGNLNRDDLVQKLEATTAMVDRLQVYQTTPLKLDIDDPAVADYRERGAHAVLFFSSSAVHSFADQAELLTLSQEARIPLAGSIGPSTSETMKERGLAIAFEAETPGLDPLVRALVEKLTS